MADVSQQQQLTLDLILNTVNLAITIYDARIFSYCDVIQY